MKQPERNIDLRDFIGKTCWRVEQGNYAGYVTLSKYEIMEAPGQHNYNSVASCWLIGKLINKHSGKPLQRPVYIDIPWKSIVYNMGAGGFHMTREAAIDELELAYSVSISKLREGTNEAREGVIES